MFDWNDEEISDIIWGESGESDDHIVPYPKGREGNALFPLRDYGKKQFNQGATVEENRLGAKKEFPGIKHENCHFEANEELSAPILGMELWPDLPPSRADKYDQDMGSEESYDFTNLTNFNLVKGEAELFGNDQEDQEDEGFLDYSWANIDNFDDLDRIFRNDDSTLDHELIANTDELWSSSVVADVINGSSTQSFSTTVSSPSSDFQAIRPTTEQQTQFVAFKSQSGKGNKLSSVCPNNVQPSKDKGAEFVNQVTGGKPTRGVKREDSTETTAETKVPKFMESNGRIHAHVSEKVNRQRKLLKSRKRTEEMNETKFVKNRSGAWSPPMNQLKQLENTRISVSSLQSFPSPVLVGPESLRYLHASNPYMHNAYGYPVHQFHIMPQLPHIYTDRGLGQSLESCKVFPDSLNHANLLKQLPDSQSKPPIMTPQEKIEKLRRRQQIQAMLAIQRQQQKLGHQIYGPDSQGVQGNQCQDATSNSIEVEDNALNLQSSLEMNLLIDQDDSSKTALMVDEFLLAETILGQLQDAIRKLDKKAKLCIRDSLFRLARSAVQRHSVNDTRSTNKSSRDKSEVIADEEMNSHDSSTRLPDAETDTNPIDRTVAHLLFHRPPDPSSGLPIKEGIPESPISASPEKFYPQPRTANSADSAAGLSSESLTEKQNTIHFESQNPSL